MCHRATRVLYPVPPDLRKGEAAVIIVLSSQNSGSSPIRVTEMSSPGIESGRDGSVCAYLSLR